jgi:hypothetical protein
MVLRWGYLGAPVDVMRKLKDPLIRFWDKVELSNDGCWIWKGSLWDGYGYFSVGSGRHVLAHKWFWEQLNGLVPKGFELDHLCRVRGCVNPAHLEAVTHRMNMLRSPIQITSICSAKTHCKRGHEFTESNTMMYDGKRLCKTCKNQYARDSYWRLKSA